MAFVKFGFKSRIKIGDNDVVTLTKHSKFYFSKVFIKNNDIETINYDFLYDDDNKSLIAFKFHNEGRFKIGNPTRSSGYYANSTIFLKKIGYQNEQKKAFRYKKQDGLIVIDLLQDEIRYD